MVTFLLLLLFALGARINITYNSDTQSARVDATVFNLINLVKCKFFLWKGDIYYKINKGTVKKIEPDRSQKRKTVFADFPKITVHRLFANVNINSSENALVPVFASIAVKNLLENINLLGGNFLAVKEKRVTVYPAYEGRGIKFNFSFRPNFAVFAIFKWGLHTLLLTLFKKQKRGTSVQTA